MISVEYDGPTPPLPFKEELVRPVAKLMTPGLVADSFARIGRFASICKSDDPDAELKDEVARRIGMHCIYAGHFSACRGIQWQFRITNMSRVCSHQLVRHHVGVAINQASGVYGVQEDEFVLPSTVIAQAKLHPEVARSIDIINHSASVLYDRLRALGVSPSDARYMMPQARVTHMNISVTPEALIHLANERLCSKAQWEIRSVVQQMCNEVIKCDPEWRPYLKPKCFRYNKCTETNSCGLYAETLNKLGLTNAPISK